MKQSQKWCAIALATVAGLAMANSLRAQTVVLSDFHNFNLSVTYANWNEDGSQIINGGSGFTPIITSGPTNYRIVAQGYGSGAYRSMRNALRSARNEEKAGRLTVVNGADPLNLVGVLLPGAKVPALYGNRVLYRDGVAVAVLVAGEVRYFEQVTPEQAWEFKNLLLRSAAPATLAALM